MSAPLAALRDRGFLSPLDLHLAEMLARIARDGRDEVRIAAALVSRQIAQGDVCLDLRQPPVAVDEAGEPIAGSSWPEPERWIGLLRSSRLVDDLGGAATNDEEGRRPLVLDPAGRLYLRRYWVHQKELADALRDRARALPEPADPGRLRRSLKELFRDDGGVPPAAVLWQRAAAVTAALRGLTIITGGPGTGKTSTVVKILALLVEQAIACGRGPLRIALLAPTGKAAARLTGSIREARGKLDCDDAIRDAIPAAAATIHRCLGASGGGGRFRHHAGNPLVADMVVVDEASMVDLALMNRLVAAIPARARLILLGDRDQLASVEAGSVLGDLCDREAMRGGYSAAHLARLREHGVELPVKVGAGGLRDSIVELVHSYRFDERSAIGRLAAAIRGGAVDTALEGLSTSGSGEVSWIAAPAGGRLHDSARQRIVEGFGAHLGRGTPAEALAALDRFRVLCAHRKGPDGVESVNALVEALLREERLLEERGSTYRGRPVVITRNDYSLGLFNGDVGVIVPDPADRERRIVVFPGPDEKLRELSPTRLPAHETAFAMSIHKSQGSEFDEVLVLLPEKISPVVTRELLYTAVTRARRRVAIHSTREGIEAAIRTVTQRASGLRDLLWNRS